MGHTLPLFSLFLVFSNKQYNFGPWGWSSGQSSNPAEVSNFSEKLVLKRMKINQLKPRLAR